MACSQLLAAIGRPVARRGGPRRRRCRPRRLQTRSARLYSAADAPAIAIEDPHADLPGLRPGGGRRRGGDLFMSLLPLVLIFVVFYFLLIRPQQTKMKQHRAMVEDLKKGDQIVTAGGIIGKVTRVEAGDNTLMVEIAPNVQVKVVRHTVADLLSLTHPATATTTDAPPPPARRPLRRLPRQAHGQEVSPAAPIDAPKLGSPGAPSPSPPSACSASVAAAELPVAVDPRRLAGLAAQAADHARARPPGRLLPAARGRPGAGLPRAAGEHGGRRPRACARRGSATAGSACRATRWR